ncbi:extensin family protein [Jannaschia sp. Os4]|uniref:extensin family protein n=1 Tax=Jannaschia sp. Os4 TaxID=2807617 RepID=UPI001939F615|nr:extensin family protein [Jannaschia sp. Os4]
MRAAALVLLLATPAWAQVDGSVAPEPRPADLSGDVAEDPSLDGSDGAEAAEDDTPAADASDGIAAGAEATRDAAPIRETLALSDEAYATCLAALDEIGATYSEVDPIVAANDPDCGILRPVELSEVLPGIAFEPANPLRCDAALATARWTRDFVLPATERVGRGDLTAIGHAATYVCRRRNNQPDGKPSEHSFGNAVDVISFSFSEGEPIAIMPRERDGTLAEAFQDAVRASACMEFTTVLGPGSDEYHDDHLHLDMVERDGGFRLCQ